MCLRWLFATQGGRTSFVARLRFQTLFECTTKPVLPESKRKPSATHPWPMVRRKAVTRTLRGPAVPLAREVRVVCGAPLSSSHAHP
eukprot:1885896-Prymnesium_polylepis.1